MKNIFTEHDYLSILRKWVDSCEIQSPIKALAHELGVHMSKLSKVLAGDQHLTADQAFVVAGFLKMDDRETEYFVTLVQYERASKLGYRNHLRKKLTALREDFRPLPLTPHREKLSRSQEAVLHSAPEYLAIWHCSMIEGERSIGKIAKMLDLDITFVAQIASFLEKIGLVHVQMDQIRPLARHLTVPGNSEQLENFLSNWRFVGMRKLNSNETGNLFYSLPMSLSHRAYLKMRERLQTAMNECEEIMASEKSEVVACLNIDLFKI